MWLFVFGLDLGNPFGARVEDEFLRVDDAAAETEHACKGRGRRKRRKKRMGRVEEDEGWEGEEGEE